ncbi:MAG: NUDIX domain-containing protein, partial [Pseudomonadota bacterium]
MTTSARTAVPFRYCPACGQEALTAADAKSVRCEACGFRYFHNCATAAGVVVRFEDEVLFIERGHDPARGLLDVPGGFADYDESLEQAALRETREETGIALDGIRYLASFPNRYDYAGVLYHTCDVFFEAELQSRPVAVAADDAKAIVWRRP